MNGKEGKETNNTVDPFLLEDYKQKIAFLQGQYTRMWTRFNFFLTIESGLLASKVFAKEGELYDTNTIFWGLIVISFLWYVVGAQDKYVMDVYRSHVEEAFQRIKEQKAFDEERFNIPYVGEIDMQAYSNYLKRKKAETTTKEIKSHLADPSSWRIEKFSLTHLVAYVPLLLILVWVFLKILIWK